MPTEYVLHLAWNPSAGATGYRLYFGPSSQVYTDPDSPVDVGNATDVQGAVPHYGAFYIAVKAYNAGGESDFSNEVSATFIQTTMPVFGSMSG